MSELLITTAIGRISGAEAQEALDAFVKTNPWMVCNRTLQAAPEQSLAGVSGGDAQPLPG